MRKGKIKGEGEWVSWDRGTNGPRCGRLVPLSKGSRSDYPAHLRSKEIGHYCHCTVVSNFLWSLARQLEEPGYLMKGGRRVVGSRDNCNRQRHTSTVSVSK